MKRITLMIVGLCLAVAPAVQAEQWSKTYTLTGKPELRVETSDANISVDTWDQNTIAATVTTDNWKIGEGGVKVLEHQTGDSVELEVRLPHQVCFICVNVHSHRVDVEIHMPREGRVNLRTGDGSIRRWRPGHRRSGWNPQSSHRRRPPEGDGAVRWARADQRRWSYRNPCPGRLDCGFRLGPALGGWRCNFATAGFLRGRC